MILQVTKACLIRCLRVSTADKERPEILSEVVEIGVSWSWPSGKSSSRFADHQSTISTIATLTNVHFSTRPNNVERLILYRIERNHAQIVVSTVPL